MFFSTLLLFFSSSSLVDHVKEVVVYADPYQHPRTPPKRIYIYRCVGNLGRTPTIICGK
jgi:hypothetical protein